MINWMRQHGFMVKVTQKTSKTDILKYNVEFKKAIEAVQCDSELLHKKGLKAIYIRVQFGYTLKSD